MDMKKFSICSFLLLQFILCVASLACAAPMNAANVNATTTKATNPTNNVPQTMLHAIPLNRPQMHESITLEDVWRENGGARLYFMAIRTPQQLFTAGYPWIDPASTPLLQPISSYPPAKKKVYRRAKPKKVANMTMKATPTVSQNQIKQGTALAAPTNPATVKQPTSAKKKEDTAETFDNLYTVPK